MAKVALFIPCFVDAIFPRVGVATLKILREFGYEVVYPQNQTCCGQPFFNSGYLKEAKDLAGKFYDDFKDYDYIIAPSASCISMVKIHYRDLLDSDKFREISSKSFEICEFLHDIVEPKSFNNPFPHTIALHQSCHGLRELELATPSERNLPYHNKIENLLKLVDDIAILPLKDAQECCGFGGTFSINEREVSQKMGHDKLANFRASGAEYLVGYDNSCLMHLASLDPNLKSLHVIEILAGVAHADI